MILPNSGLTFDAIGTQTSKKIFYEYFVPVFWEFQIFHFLAFDIFQKWSLEEKYFVLQILLKVT